MAKQVIEPSEIITGEGSFKTANVSHVNPWARLIARFFDYALLSICLRLWVPQVFSLVPWIPIEYALWIPLEAILLATWGATPGKFLLGTRLSQRYRRRIAFKAAVERSLYVWFRGLGMGIPFVSFFCLANAYNRLKLQGGTSWDRDTEIQIEHRSISPYRIYFAAACALAGYIFYISAKNL